MRIILIGMGGFYNRGCEAIARGSAKILREAFPGVEIAVAVGDTASAHEDRKRLPDIEMEIYPQVEHKKVAALPLRLVRRAVYQLTGNVALYRRWRPLGYPDRGWNLVLEVGGDTYAHNPLFRFDYDKWLIETKKLSVGLWGMNLGPYGSKLISKKKLAEAFSRYRLITVRDDWSLRYLTGLGVKENVYRMADPAFEMDLESWDIDQYFPAQNASGVIGLNLSPLASRYRNESMQGVSQLVIDTARGLNEMGFGVLLVPHCFPPACPRNDDDTVVLKPAFQQLRSEGANIGMLPNGISSPQVKYAISQCTLFAGSRMHATISACSTGVPVFTISYSQKSLNMNDEVYGHRRYVVDIRSVTVSDMIASLGAMAKEIESLRSQTQASVKRLREHTRHMLSRVATTTAS